MLDSNIYLYESRVNLFPVRGRTKLFLQVYFSVSDNIISSRSDNWFCHPRTSGRGRVRSLDDKKKLKKIKKNKNFMFFTLPVDRSKPRGSSAAAEDSPDDKSAIDSRAISRRPFALGRSEARGDTFSPFAGIFELSAAVPRDVRRGATVSSPSRLRAPHSPIYVTAC